MANQNGSVITPDQLELIINRQFEQIHRALEGNPHAQRMVELLYDNSRMQFEVMKASLEAMLNEAKSQRDYAIHEAREWREHGMEKAKRRLAAKLALDTDNAVTVLDIMRLIDFAYRDGISADDPQAREFMEAAVEYMAYLHAEEILNGADHDE